MMADAFEQKEDERKKENRIIKKNDSFSEKIKMYFEFLKTSVDIKCTSLQATIWLIFFFFYLALCCEILSF